MKLAACVVCIVFAVARQAECDVVLRDVLKSGALALATRLGASLNRDRLSQGMCLYSADLSPNDECRDEFKGTRKYLTPNLILFRYWTCGTVLCLPFGWRVLESA